MASSSSPRPASRTSRATGKPATPKAFSPPDKVTRQYRKEFNQLLERLPDCDLDLKTVVVSTHCTVQRRGTNGKLERLQLSSAHDAHGRTTTWIELIKGERSFPQLSSTIQTPAKSGGKGKGKQRVEDSDDDDDMIVLPASDDDLYAEVAPPRTPRKSHPSSSSSRAVVINPRKQDGSSPLLKDGSRVIASSRTPGEEPADVEDPDVKDLAECLSTRLWADRRPQRDPAVRASPRLNEIRRNLTEASPYVAEP